MNLIKQIEKTYRYIFNIRQLLAAKWAEKVVMVEIWNFANGNRRISIWDRKVGIKQKVLSISSKSAMLLNVITNPK